MRGSSSAGMPAPVSRHRDDDGIGRPGRRASRRPAGRRVLDGVVEQVGEHLAQPVAIDVGDELRRGRGRRCGRRAPRRRPRTARRVCRIRSCRSVGSRRSAIVPVSASEMSISVLSIAIDAIGFLEAVGERFAQRRGIVGAQRCFGDAAQPRHRRAQVVGDVVERAAHAGEHRVDAIEHRVDQRRSARRARRRCSAPARARRCGRSAGSPRTVSASACTGCSADGSGRRRPRGR